MLRLNRYVPVFLAERAQSRWSAAVRAIPLRHTASHTIEKRFTRAVDWVCVERFRDDPRTRRGASGFPRGEVRGGTAREGNEDGADEDGADDHMSKKKDSESVREKRASTVSEWRSPSNKTARYSAPIPRCFAKSAIAYHLYWEPFKKELTAFVLTP